MAEQDPQQPQVQTSTISIVQQAPVQQVTPPPNSATTPVQNVQGKANPNTGPYSVPPPDIPPQEGPFGIRYDFNGGARLLLPQGDWHAEIFDDESGNIIFSCDSQGGWITSTKKYFVWFGFRVWKKGEINPASNMSSISRINLS